MIRVPGTRRRVGRAVACLALLACGRSHAPVLSRLAAREREIVGILHRAGVPLLAATETHAGSGVWGFAVHDELATLVAAGLTPAAALRAATLEPARALGMQDSLGIVAPGRLADLVLLDADPLADIAHATRIRAVLSNGRLYDRSALDGLLADVARAVGAPTPR
jgi:imidazolonepropionase-like amidohydrolase